MGRRVGFDRELALQGALKCFWRDGYDKTSLDDLLREMGIKTSSFYNSFESKEALFLESVQLYRNTLGKNRLDLLREGGAGGLSALRAYFENLIFYPLPNYPTGCFMTKTAANLADPDSIIGREVSIAMKNIENGLLTALERAQKSGEVRASLNLHLTCRLLLAEAFGISVLTRTAKSKAELLETSQALLDLLA